MSLYAIGKNEPIGIHGGRNIHYLVSCKYAAGEEDYQESISFMGQHCYTTDRFPLGILDLAETYPYQVILPPVEGDGFIIDRKNPQIIVSVYRDGIALESLLYEEEPQDAEYNRLAAAHDLNEPTLHEIEDYVEHTQSVSAFFDRDEYLGQASSYRNCKIGGFAAIAIALFMLVSTGLDFWRAHQIKEETGEIARLSDELSKRKITLEAQLKRRGLSAEEEYRTDQVRQALENLYPAPIIDFGDANVRLHVDQPELVHSIPEGRLIEPHKVQVTLKDLSFMNENAAPSPVQPGQ